MRFWRAPLSVHLTMACSTGAGRGLGRTAGHLCLSLAVTVLAVLSSLCGLNRIYMQPRQRHWIALAWGFCLISASHDAQLYWANPQRPWRYVSVPEFAEHFRNFSVGREISQRLASPPPPAPLSAKHAASGHDEVCGCVKV